MIRIRDKPPVSNYPVTDRIIGAVASAVLLATMLCFASTGGRTRESHAPTHEADKPIEAAVAYQRPAETGRIEELIEYRNPTPLSDELFRAVDAAAVEHGVPVCLALGLIQVESSFDPDAVSSHGSYGLCQLNPKFFPSGLSAEENVQTGLAHLGDLLAQYDTMTALTIYNAGRDTGDREYANKVMEAAWAWEWEFREGANADGIYRRGTG